LVRNNKRCFFGVGHEDILRDARGQLPNDVSILQSSQSGAKVKRFEVIQNAGDVIFIPSGWHHQVYNEVSQSSKRIHCNNNYQRYL